MAILGVTTITVRPGKWDAELDELRQIKGLLEGTRAQNVRLFAPYSGPADV
jgi:hypothetical protein